jgi:2-haloacid dehalogenase
VEWNSSLAITYLTMDCYGTLVDWRTGIVESFLESFFREKKTPKLGSGELFERYVKLEARQEKEYTSYREILRKTSHELALQIGVEDQYVSSSAITFSKSIEKWPAFADSQVTLREFGRMGFKRFILSNVDREILEKTITNSRLEIDGFVTADQIRSYKPSKVHWLQFLKTAGASKNEVLHIAGSIYHDIIPASELGIRTVWVDRYHDGTALNASPDFTVSSLSEIPELLKGIS